jgi:hypothetical protein
MVTSNSATDQDLVGAELVFGTTPIGQVLSVERDPVSHRVRRLLATYGDTGRRVAIPLEWVVRRTSTSVTLGVGVRSLDDLADQRELGPLHSRS